MLPCLLGDKVIKTWETFFVRKGIPERSVIVCLRPLDSSSISLNSSRVCVFFLGGGGGLAGGKIKAVPENRLLYARY
jgi:hypothetical protein